MRKPPLQKKPPYALTSVDNALRLVQLLRDTGSVRNKDAADELGIAPSSAHRLLSMLVYRGFAVQDETHLYSPGPALGEPAVEDSGVRMLKFIVEPHLERLVEQFGESANLVIRVGRTVRFLATVESPHPLRVGDRRGAVIEAHRASGGKALLAELNRKTLERLYLAELLAPQERLSEGAFATLLRELEVVRRTGLAINREGTETGVSAVGIAVHDGERRAVAAVSVSSPSSRFETIMNPALEAGLFDVREQVERDLERVGG